MRRNDARARLAPPLTLHRAAPHRKISVCLVGLHMAAVAQSPDVRCIQQLLAAALPFLPAATDHIISALQAMLCGSETVKSHAPQSLAKVKCSTALCALHRTLNHSCRFIARWYVNGLCAGILDGIESVVAL